MNWVTPEKEIQEGTTQEPNASEGTPKVNWEARHKEASDALSQKAEQDIKTNIKLANLDPKEILSMDSKMQNKVIGEIYWYNNVEELKLIQGEEFWKSGEDQDLTSTEELAQKVKLLEYQNKKWGVDRAIEEYVKDNKKIFEDDSEALTKLNAELSYISDTLPVKDRVQRAWKILFWDNYVDSTTATYLSMQDQSMSAGSRATLADWKPQENSFKDFAKARGFLK